MSEEQDSAAVQTWVPEPDGGVAVLVSPCCVAVGELPNLPVPRFPYKQNGAKSLPHRIVVRINECFEMLRRMSGTW